MWVQNINALPINYVEFTSSLGIYIQFKGIF